MITNEIKYVFRPLGNTLIESTSIYLNYIMVKTTYNDGIILELITVIIVFFSRQKLYFINRRYYIVIPIIIINQFQSERLG